MTDDEYADHLDEALGHAKKALRAMDDSGDRRMFAVDVADALHLFISAGCPA